MLSVNGTATRATAADTSELTPDALLTLQKARGRIARPKLGQR